MFITRLLFASGVVLAAPFAVPAQTCTSVYTTSPQASYYPTNVSYDVSCKRSPAYSTINTTTTFAFTCGQPDGSTSAASNSPSTMMGHGVCESTSYYAKPSAAYFNDTTHATVGYQGLMTQYMVSNGTSGNAVQTDSTKSMYFSCTNQCTTVSVCSGTLCGNTCYAYIPTCTSSGSFNEVNVPAYCCGDDLCCPTNSPIVIDTKNEGFHLTSQPQGVSFAIAPGATPIKISWTDAAHSNGWLALDRNGNGLIDDMSELFGNLTPQPNSADPNGFAALKMFDDPRQGGNGNGFLDPGDAIYSSLRIWIDKNHNGFSEPNELYTLPEVGLFSISLQYQSDSFADAFGNSFRYRSTVSDMTKGPYDKKCYDVFLLSRITHVQ